MVGNLKLLGSVTIVVKKNHTLGSLREYRAGLINVSFHWIKNKRKKNKNLLAVSEAAADMLCVAGGRPLPPDVAVYDVTFPDSYWLAHVSLWKN